MQRQNKRSAFLKRHAPPFLENLRYKHRRTTLTKIELLLLFDAILRNSLGEKIGAGEGNRTLVSKNSRFSSGGPVAYGLRERQATHQLLPDDPSWSLAICPCRLVLGTDGFTEQLTKAGKLEVKEPCSLVSAVQRETPRNVEARYTTIYTTHRPSSPSDLRKSLIQWCTQKELNLQPSDP